jgi:hypothetical protein
MGHISFQHKLMCPMNLPGDNIDTIKINAESLIELVRRLVSK